MSDIANKLKKLREEAKYTINQVANALGISRIDYRDYESGEFEPSCDILEKASTLYGCDTMVFFEVNENEEALTPVWTFQLKELTDADAHELMKFMDIVKSYLKMEIIEVGC